MDTSTPLVRSCSSAQYHYIRLCQIHNSDLNCKMKNWKYTSGCLSNFEKWTKLVSRLTIIESSSNQKSNHREHREYSLSFSLPWQSFVWDIQKATTDSPSTTEFLLPVKNGWWFYYALYSVWSYNKISVQFWFRAQTGYWLELEPSDLGKSYLTHQKYSLVNLKREKRPTWS